MLGIDPRTLRVVWTVFLFGLIIAVVYFIRETLLLFALAVFFAYMLSPLVQLVQRITPRRRGLALAIVYIILVGAIVGISISLGSRIAEQATTLVKSLPDMLDPKRLNTIQLPSWLAPLEPLRQRAVEAAQSETSNLQKSIIPILQRASGQILAGLSSAFLIVLVPILSFFLLKDARQISTALVGSFESGERTLMRQIIGDIHLVLSKYIRSLVLLAVAAFAAWAIFLSILGTPYQMLLAGRLWSARVHSRCWSTRRPCRHRSGVRHQRVWRHLVGHCVLGQFPHVPGLRTQSISDEFWNRDSSIARSVRCPCRRAHRRHSRDVLLGTGHRDIESDLYQSAPIGGKENFYGSCGRLAEFRLI